MNEKLKQLAETLPNEVVKAVMMCDNAEEIKKVLDESKITYSEEDITLVVNALEEGVIPLSDGDLEKVAGGTRSLGGGGNGTSNSKPRRK